MKKMQKIHPLDSNPRILFCILAANYRKQIAITAAMLDFLKIWKMCFCCTINQLHLINQKDQPPGFRHAPTFLYPSCKLSIIIAITAAMLDFMKIWNMSFFEKMAKISNFFLKTLTYYQPCDPKFASFRSVSYCVQNKTFFRRNGKIANFGIFHKIFKIWCSYILLTLWSIFSSVSLCLLSFPR